jgi:cardiolipin synthase A/B
MKKSNIRNFLKVSKNNYLNYFKKYNKIELTIIIVGILGIFVLITSLFLPENRHSEEIITTPVEARSPDFLNTLSRLVNAPVGEGQEVVVLNNGDEFLPALIEAIDSASSTINFTTYIWKDGKFSDQVMDALLKASRRGVQVRVLLDGFAGHPPKTKVKDLRESGAKVETFRGISYKFTNLHKRTHRRAIVIDGKLGFTGGMAIADMWLGNGKKKDEWRDMMFEVKGKMAESLQSAFVDLWNETTGEILAGSDFYPYSEAFNTQSSNKYLHLVSMPTEGSQPVQLFFLVTAMSAEEKLYILNPYMLPDKPLLKVLTDKAKEGVDVRILVPGGNTDGKQVRWASQTNYENLLEAGVKIYEYDPSMYHTKVIIVDGIWSVIGSANIDSRSRALNNENIMGVLDADLARELEINFYEDLNFSKEIILDEWKKRNPFSRLLSWVSLFFAKQY